VGEAGVCSETRFLLTPDSGSEDTEMLFLVPRSIFRYTAAYLCFLDKIPCFSDTAIMAKPRRVAVMLDLEWSYKRHVGIFAGSQQFAEEQGWESTIDEFVHETLRERGTKAVPYDGIIARATKKLADRAAQLNIPLVNVWLSSPVQEMLPGVYPDYRSIGRMRAEHLLTRGFRRFAALASRTNRAHEIEIEAFRRTVAEEGFPCITDKVPLSPSRTYASWRRTEKIIAAWMSQWQLPIGVCLFSDEIGRMVVQMCRTRGWRVPEDVALIAGMNEETICEHPAPTLTSVEVGYERVGYEAGRLLKKLMNAKGRRNKRTGPPEHRLLPPQGLIVRQSTDFFAVDDELISSALEFIAANSHRKIGPDDVARAVTTETRTLQRRFRKYLNRPIATEIRRVRIERAKRELTQSKRPLSEIARDVGFGEPMRMYEVFRRELGVTPSQYRRERQVQDEV
jgi:LacI family transcriptional regulator